MSYLLKLTADAIEDIEYLKKSGDKATLRKLAVLLVELTEHPRTGTGQPEELKYNFSGCWSRRITSFGLSNRRKAGNRYNTFCQRPLYG